MGILWWLVLGADALLILAVAALLWRLSRPGSPVQAASPADLERFLAEAGRLGKEFDRLLAEKRELVGTILASLDQRLARLEGQAAEADAAAARLEKALAAAKALPATLHKHRPKTAAPPPSAATPAEENQTPDFRRQVERLTSQGRTPAQVAEATGRPIGEVELVLGLGGKG